MKIIVCKKEIDIEFANTFLKKLQGFMFKRNIDICLGFKTNSIHTFFMKENIDILMTDKNNIVLYIFKSIPKNRIIIKKGVYYTYEFPNNFLNNSNIQINDKLIIKK